MSPTLLDRALVDVRAIMPTSRCIEWMGARNSDGYGCAWVDGRLTKAHRSIYERMVGPIPSGLELDHLCRNRGCINPQHLEPVTGAENKRRQISYWGSRTHCSNGHPFDATNTIIERGARCCLICKRARNRASFARRAPFLDYEHVNAQRRARYAGRKMVSAMIAFWILVALIVELGLAIAVGKQLARRRKRDDWMALADACQSGTTIYDALAAEMRFDPIDPAAVERIKARVEDELAARRGRV